MGFFDKTVAEIIWESDNDKIKQKGLYIISGKKFRNFKIGNYGSADILTVKRTFKGNNFDSFHNENGHGLLFTIYVVKEGKIGISAFLKAVSCARGISSYLKTTRKTYFPFDIKLVLVGKELDKSGAFVYLSDIFGFDCEYKTRSVIDIDFFTYFFDIDGIHFCPESQFKLNQEGF
jgi:hypothetical protein